MVLLSIFLQPTISLKYFPVPVREDSETTMAHQQYDPQSDLPMTNRKKRIAAFRDDKKDIQLLHRLHATTLPIQMRFAFLPKSIPASLSSNSYQQSHKNASNIL